MRHLASGVLAWQTIKGSVRLKVKSMKESLGGGDKPDAPASEPLGTHGEIGRKLKQYYDGLVSEEVPDRFAVLLAQLEAAEASRKQD